MSEDPLLSPWRQWILKLRGKQFTSKSVIDVYMATIARLSYGNYLWWKHVRGAWRSEETARLHLGCGPVYLPEWINVDALLFWKRDLWLDLRYGLPFRDGTIEAIYANQVFEHFTLPVLRRLLAECHRVLKPGGILRLAVPSFEHAARAYVEGRREFFEEHAHAGRSLAAQANDFLLCQNHHLILFDDAFARDLLAEAGAWSSIVAPPPGESRALDAITLERAEGRWPKLHQTCVVLEAQRS
jgi:SAM-dependent methyltransferase